MSEPIQGGSELNEAKEGFGELVVASGDAAMRFDAAKEGGADGVRPLFVVPTSPPV